VTAHGRVTLRKARLGLVIAAVVTLCTLAAAIRARPRDAAPLREPPRPRRLLIAADGVSAEAFAEAQRRGLFRRFRYSAKHVATYPSLSTPSWAEVIGTPRAFGARGVVPSVEARYFDVAAGRIVDDPREIVARHASPYSHYRAFDSYYDPITEPLMFLPGETLARRELAQTERAILDGFTGPEFVAYVGGSDATAHTHLGALARYLAELDGMIGRVADSLEARGTPAELWLVSDHGNVGAFREGQAERYLTPVSLGGAIARAGLVRVDTGSVDRPHEVAVVDLALGTVGMLYFADLGRRRDLARAALREAAVELVTWLEVRPGDRHVAVMGRDGSEARLRWRGSWYSYEPVRGNPLDVPAAFASPPGRPRWVHDSVLRAATRDGRFPDAAYRLARSADKQVENAPDLIVSLRDGYVLRGDLGRAVRMVRTHGALSARSSEGILATSARPLPPAVRGDEVLGLVGVRPEHLLDRAADLLPAASPEDRAEQLARGSGYVATGREDHSVDAEFLRRARPVVLSMEWFGVDAVRALLAAAAGARAGTAQATRTRDALRGADVLGGLSRNVDRLLPVVDSIGVPPLDLRVRNAERVVAGIGELAPLRALLPSPRTTAARAGAGAPLRRVAMALWTVPYFLDAALLAPEEDSIPDPRDVAFARRWFATGRPRVLGEPGALLRDAAVAPHLFREVFAERKLARRVDPAQPALLYDRDVSATTLVYVPGIYGELFDGEIWSRGLRGVRERLAMRTLTVPVDGRCSAPVNGRRIVEALHADTRRRLERGHPRPRYLIVGYSKGGVDATEALLMDRGLAREQVSALVTVATPHLGSPVAERVEIPDGVLAWGVASARPAACDTAGASGSLHPAVRSAFWSARGADVSGTTRLFSLSFAASAEAAHPWMKLTKRVAGFREPNDGVVAVSASRFPRDVPAVDLGVVDADHIAGRLASSFPQDALLEAIVVAVAELGGLDPGRADAWRSAAARHAAGASGRSRGMVSFASDVRPLGGRRATTWTPERTFRTSEARALADAPPPTLTPRVRPEGIVFRCDQRDMTAFRREYEFSYDASSGGREHDATDGFAVTSEPGAANGRACHLASRGSVVKMTTIAHRFSPRDFPVFSARLRVVGDVAGVDGSRAAEGKNDAALKFWLVLRDTRAGDGRGLMFGYAWSSPDRRGVAPPPGALREAISSRRNLVVTTLPPAWFVAVGGPSQRGRWTVVERDLAADLRRAYPDIPTEALEVVAITVQTDSDDSRGSTAVFLESFGFSPRAGARLASH
jgi:hypothetical protein